MLVGFGAGWVVSRQQDESEFNQRMEKAKISIEASMHKGEAKAKETVEKIKASDGGKKVKSFSKQMADYYHAHAKSEHKDEQTKQVLSWMEQMAKTNDDVAEVINASGQ